MPNVNALARADAMLRTRPMSRRRQVIITRSIAPRGKAILRLAICGIGARSIAATVNDEFVGNVTGLTYNATINRDGIGGAWCERDLVFNAAQMKAGENVLKLTIPGGGLTSGIIYDYLRLELDEDAAAK